MILFLKNSSWHFFSLGIAIAFTVFLIIFLIWINKRVVNKKKLNNRIISIKIELARTYIEVGQYSRAIDILEETLDTGNIMQRSEAKGLLNDIRFIDTNDEL